jgi:putative flippase GtrA
MRTKRVSTRGMPLIQRSFKVVRFLSMGIPTFGVAVAFNYILVRWAAWPKALTYAVVLWFQVSVNFLLCRWFVFPKAPSSHLWKQYGAFVTGILLFRAGDWALYSLMVTFTPVHFLLIQFINVMLFSLAKFAFAERVMEGRRAGVDKRKD